MTNSESTDKLKILSEIVKTIGPNVESVDEIILTWEEIGPDGLVCPIVKIRGLVLKKIKLQS